MYTLLAWLVYLFRKMIPFEKFNGFKSKDAKIVSQDYFVLCFSITEY